FLVFSFFLQAEDCIRDRNVTGVQQCALPIASNCNAYATQFETYSHDHSPPRRCSASNCNAYALNLRHTAMTILHRGGVLHPIAMHTPLNLRHKPMTILHRRCVLDQIAMHTPPTSDTRPSSVLNEELVCIQFQCIRPSI